MSTRKSTSKPKHLQPVKPDANPYDVAMRKLGLDWPSIDRLADDFKTSGDDDHLVLTIVLLRRLLKLADLGAVGPESIDNYLALLIDRLYRATHHCEGEADRFALQADQALRAKNRPTPVSERRAS